MAFLFTKKNRTHDVQTRIVKHEGESHDQSQVRIAAGTAFAKPTAHDWSKSNESFSGFNSPPGRF